MKKYKTKFNEVDKEDNLSRVFAIKTRELGENALVIRYLFKDRKDALERIKSIKRYDFGGTIDRPVLDYKLVTISTSFANKLVNLFGYTIN